MIRERNNFVIRGGRVIDPANNIDGVMDVLVEDGKISSVSGKIKKKVRVVEAGGKLVIPGLFDMHVHLREPGREDEETVSTGTKAASHGGFTGILCMPNTEPPVDNAEVVRFILSQAEKAKSSKVYPVGTITRGLKGEELSDIGELREAGVVAISDDGETVRNSGLMRCALEYANMFDLVVICHCEDKDLSADGVMNEGYVSTVLGLPGSPSEAEELIVARDIMLSQLTGARIHIAHVSTKGSVALIRSAKERGIKVSAETAPHYFSLTDEEVRSFNANLRVNPPLRSADDAIAIKKALRDGIIDCVATDHAPHSIVEKEFEFALAPPGMIGLETALSLMLKLVEEGTLGLSEAISKMSINPARILGLQSGTLSRGAPADITIVEPEKEYVVREESFFSKSKNSPFIGWRLKGVVERVFLGGEVIF